MLSQQDNERVTRVGAATPMGDVFRRYWLPAALSSELPEADGAPVRVRLLGEDLIAFRDSDGIAGLVGAFCPHRRAPMFFGRNEGCGLRCVYHGWKFDRSGTCVDMPSEPPDSLFKGKVAIESYPVWEGGGIVWTYMGPAAEQPPPPDYEWIRAPATHRYTSKSFEDCNYLQALEGGLDTSHTGFLHYNNHGDTSYMEDFAANVSAITVEKTGYGYTYYGIRRLGSDQWVRGYQYIMPVMQMRGTVGGKFLRPGDVPRIDGHMWIPMDDVTTMVYHFMYSYAPDHPIPVETALQIEASFGRGPGDYEPGPGFRLKAKRDNDYFIDRVLQKTVSMTGIPGTNTQDMALQEGMGAIVDRTQEHLGTSDRAIIVMRQLLLEATYAVEGGEAPRGTDPESYRAVRAFDRIVPADRPWRDQLREEMVARF